MALWVVANGMGVGWLVAKAKTKKQDDTNSRVWSGYNIHMFLQRANILLQGLDRQVLMVEEVSGEL